MKFPAVFALPLAVAGLLGATTIVAKSATLEESQIAGIVTGEALCVLKRYDAPPSVMRAELERLTHKMLDRNVLSAEYKAEYLRFIDGILKQCPAKPSLPDA